MSAEDKAHLASLNRAVRMLAGQIEALINQEFRRDLLRAAQVVVSPESSLLEKQFAATLLAQLVIKLIPAPRPVAVPSPVVSVEEEEKAC
jgi:hypothetical protein